MHVTINRIGVVYNNYDNRLGICQGEYPEFLLEAWDQFDEDEESDNDRPGEECSLITIIINYYFII